MNLKIENQEPYINQRLNFDETQLPNLDSSLSKSCKKCGRSDHQRSNSLKCPTNPKNCTTVKLHIL